MRIMKGDTPIAYSCNNDMGQPIIVKAIEGIDQNDLPLILFKQKREVSYLEFLDWVKQRCFPPNRVDRDKCLAVLGLKRYDPLEIVMKTGGRLEHHDDFWVDWE